MKTKLRIAKPFKRASECVSINSGPCLEEAVPKENIREFCLSGTVNTENDSIFMKKFQIYENSSFVLDGFEILTQNCLSLRAKRLQKSNFGLKSASRVKQERSLDELCADSNFARLHDPNLG